MSNLHNRRLAAVITSLIPVFATITCLLPSVMVAQIGDINEGMRPAVHPRRNVDVFEPVRGKYVRFVILKTNTAEPCLDELEVYSAEGGDQNMALTSMGSKVTASGTLGGYNIHRLEHVHDGNYGNGYSWISNTHGTGWIIVELPYTQSINRVVWSRDREGKFIDRLPTEYRIEVALEPGEWTEVSSSIDRKPLEVGAELYGLNQGSRQAISRFAPVSTSLSSGAAMVSADYIIDTWQTEDGLPSNTVSCILQDRTGFLWFGTFNGLARFDGLHFTVFGEKEGLSNTRVLCLLEDSDGDIWIGTEGGGLVRYRQGTFRSYTVEDGLYHDVILAIAEDREGTLWIGSLGGLNRFRDEQLLENGGGLLPPGPVSRIQPDGSGGVWLLYGDSLYHFSADGTPIPSAEGDPSSFTSLYALHRGMSGDLWFGGANGYIGRIDKGELEVIGKGDNLLTDTIWEIYETRAGDTWVGTASGGLRRVSQGQITSLTTQHGMPDNSIRAVFEDREENLWVGTNSGGLVRIKVRRLNTYTTNDGLSHEVVMSLTEGPDGQVWIGTNCGGLNIWDDQGMRPYHMNYLLDNECIWSVLATHSGDLWIGTWGAGLFRRTDGRIVNYRMSDGLNDSVILALCEDSSGGVWIGTYNGGLNYFKDDVFSSFTIEDGLSSSFVTSIWIDAEERVWIGTSGGGLNLYEDGAFRVYGRKEGVGSDFIRTIYGDADGVLWIGTGGGGLTFYDKGRFFTVTQQHGLQSNVISQVMEDDAGNLWLGSNQGIFQVAKEALHNLANGDLKRVTPVSYGKTEGMKSLECTGGFDPAGLKTHDGRLLFSTVKGLVEVNPSSLAGNTLPPPVVIEEVRVEKEIIKLVPGTHRTSTFKDLQTLEKNVPRRDEPWVGRLEQGQGVDSTLVLSPDVDQLEIHFTALSFVVPEKIRFQYRLTGLDRDWIDAGIRRVAYYSRLAPGEYRFEVTAANENGVWNSEGASLVIRVLPPFWSSWWFISLSGLMALSLPALGVRYISLKKIRTEFQKLEQAHALEKERTRIAQDIHDDLGASLTQITYLSEHCRKSVDHENRPLKESLSRIAQAARDSVRAMDQIVWAANPRNSSLNHFIDYLTPFAEDFFRNTGIRCRFDLPERVPDYQLSAEIRHNLVMAIKEIFNNTFKHSGADQVLIRLEVDGNRVGVFIRDNGTGFDLNEIRFRGNGLDHIQSRMKEVGGHAVIESARDSGTQVSLFIQF